MAKEAPVANPPTQADPKTTAANLVKNITDKANGKPQPQQKGEPLNKETPESQPDPNAGKEKYVVDGKDIWLTPEQARSYVQKGISFEPRVDQLARLQHEMGAFLQVLQEDPLRILTDKRIGLTPEIVLEKVLKSDKISESIKENVGKWYYDNVIVPAKMDPMERKAMELERENNQYKTEKQRIAEEVIKRENEYRVQSALGQLKANIAEAMKDSGLPTINSPLGSEMARMVADTMRLAYFQRQTITPKQAIEYVKNRIKQVQSAWYDNLDEENLVKELGEKNAEKVRKYFLKLAKEADKQPTVSKTPVSRNGERKTINSDDFHEYLEELKKKG